jgi:mannosyl-oligosaccharide glucosidase
MLLYHSEIRHTCEQSDSLTSYAYTQHDGRTYSSQDLVDGKNNVKITTKFLKSERGDGWAVRVRGEVIDPGKPSDNVSSFHFPLLDSIRYRPYRLDRSSCGSVELKDV